MRKLRAYFYLGFGTLLLFYRCAQMMPLSGGQKDTSPPKLVEAEPALNSKQFASDEIILKFNEFVQLKDLSTQLTVSPRLKTPPEISADGKKIVIKLKKEECSPNTTYRIFLGKAIADMTESNSIENFEYVFSTGDQLDTLELKGDVTEAFNNSPVGGVAIGLYTDLKINDSLPFLAKPNYLARSNENGEFLFKNLPARTFLVFGISDLNKNEKYDGESERVSFLNSPLQLKSDTSIKLKHFREEAPKVFIKKTLSPYPGFSQIILNKASVMQVAALDEPNQQNICETFQGIMKDTISLYYKNIQDTLGLKLSNANFTDTLKLILPKKTGNKKNTRSFNLNTTENKLMMDTKLKLNFPVWMDTSHFDLSKMNLRCKEDSGSKGEQPKGRWTSISTFEMTMVFKEGSNYSLKVDTNAFFDINHHSNDSTFFNFAIFNKTDFGKVRLKLKLNKKEAYVVQLLNEQNIVSKEHSFEFSLSSSNAKTIDFTDVLPGSYTVKIIFDTNTNQKWDHGDVILKKLPEEVIIHSKQLKVLSDWEIEEEISIR